MRHFINNFDPCHPANESIGKHYSAIVYMSGNRSLYFSGEKKLGKVITPDPWKSGASNVTGKSG
jgi:hypothetical protein